MMKRILCTIMILAISLSLCGCGTEFTDPDYNATITDSEYFKSEIVEYTNTGYIIRDVKTNILYIIIDGYNGTMIMPLYNVDGTLQTYSE